MNFESKKPLKVRENASFFINYNTYNTYPFVSHWCKYSSDRKYFLSPMVAGPFNRVKPWRGGEGREREGRGRGERGGGGGSPQPGEGKPAGKEERWRETTLESPALRKIQASNSVYTRQPRRTPFMILRNQATGVSNAFPHFSPFFFFHRHAKYTPDFETLLCEDRWFNVWRSHPGNCKHCPTKSVSQSWAPCEWE